MVVLLFFCLSTFPGLSGNVIQNRKDTVKPTVAARCVNNIKNKDSITKNSININGKLNAVSITNDNATGTNLGTDGKQKNTDNKIEINGEGNSVNIQQQKNNGKVNIRQNGTGNQVNSSQSSQNTVK